MSIVQAREQFNKQLWELVLGSVVFRASNGRSEPKRRTRTVWWSEYIGHSVPKRQATAEGVNF